MAYGASKYYAYQKKPKQKKMSEISGSSVGQKNNGGILGGIGYVGGSLLAGLGSVGEGLVDLILAGGGLLTGNTDYAEWVFKDNTVGDWYADLTEDYNPDGVMEFVGNVGHGLGQSSSFLLDLAVPGLGTGIFFAGVGSQGISSAAAQTGEVGAKEVAYGVLSGAAEAALEKVSGGMSKLATNIGSKAMKNVATTAVRKGLVKQVLSDAAGEFGEEFASEYIDTFLQRSLQIDPNKQYSLKEALYAGAVGAVSGTVSAGTGDVARAVANQRTGAKIIKNGNSQTLVNTATSVADKLAAQGTIWKKAPEWATALRGQIDAYNKLSVDQKTGMRGQTILGEMQASLYFAESQATFNLIQQSVQKASEQNRAAWAEYINRSISKENRNNKDYTAADIANNTDNVAWQLAVMRYVPGMFNFDGAFADAEQESAIDNVIARERGSAEAVQNTGAETGNAVGAEPVTVGGEKYDLVGKDANGNEIYKTSEETKKLPRKERMKKFVDIMNNEYYGRTAKFTVDGETYYARFDQKDVNKNIYGDRRSDRKGYNAKIDVGADGNIFELVENAKYQDSRAESGKITDAHKDVSEWDYFDKTVIIDGTQYDVLINIRKKENGEYVYSVQLRESKKEASSSSRAHYDNSHSSNKEDDASSGGRTPPASANTLAGTSKTSGRSSTDNSIYQTDPVVNPKTQENVSKNDLGEDASNFAREAAEKPEGADVSKKNENAKDVEKSADVAEKTTEQKNAEKATDTSKDKVDLDKAARDAERMIEWEKKNAPTVKELNTAREYIKDFDSLPKGRQMSIIRTIRSAQGVEVDTLRGVINLMAITNSRGQVLAPDLEIRFAEGIGKRGIKTKVGEKTVILIDSQTKYRETIRGTIAHEVVHYLENRKGYKELAEFAMKHAKPEKIAEVTEKYDRHYKNEYTLEERRKTPNATDEEIAARVAERMATDEYKALIDSEVTASVVGEMLNSEKFLKRYAQKDDSTIKKIGRMIKGIVTSLKDKDQKASDVAADMMKLVDRALGSEVSGESRGTRYDGADNKVKSFSKIAISTALYDALDHKDEGYDNLILMSKMPRFIEDKLGITGDFYVYRDHLYENTVSKERAIAEGRPTKRGKKDIHFHDLGEERMIEAIMSINDPVMMIEDKTADGNPAVFMVLNVLDDDGVPLYASLSFYANRGINGRFEKKPHIVLTISPRSFFSQDGGRHGYAEIISKAIEEKRVLSYDKEKGSVLSVIAQHARLGNITEASLNDSISRFKRSVNEFKQKNKINYDLSDEKLATKFDSSQVKYDLADEDGDAEAETAEAEAEKKPKVKKEIVKVATGSAEAGRYANGFKNEFGLKKDAAEKIRAELEAIEDALVKLDADTYREEYIKRVQKIFGVISRDGEFEEAEDLSYKEFQRYMYGKKFRVDQRVRQDMGKEEWKAVYNVLRGRIAGNNNPSAPHIDSFYMELNELFPGFFPDDIINVHEQLERVANVILEAKYTKGEVFAYSQLPAEMQSEIVKNVIDRVNSFVSRVTSNRDTVKILRDEKNEIAKLLKKERSLREKMAREAANAAKAERARRYTKKEVEPAVREIEELTDAEVKSLAKGFELEGMSKERRERLISDIYIALHEESARGEAGPGSVAVKVLATKMAWNMVDSARIKGEDGKYYHLNDIYDEASVQAMADEYSQVLYERFTNMGENTRNAYFQAEIRATEEEFKKERINDATIQRLSRNVSYQGMKLRDLVDHQKRGVEDDGIVKVTKVLASVVDAKGNIRTGAVDEAIAEADRFYTMERGKLDSEGAQQKDTGTNLTDFAYETNTDLQFMIDEFKRMRSRVDKGGKTRQGRALDAQEMRLLGNILAGMRKTIEQYNKVYINDRYIDIDQVASDAVRDTVEFSALDQTAKTKVGKLMGSLLKGIKQQYFYNVLTPETTIEALEGFKTGGVLKTLYHDIRVHKQRAEHIAVRMKKPFAEFIDDKKNQWTDEKGKNYSYRDKLNKKIVNVNGNEITLGEAIYLYMLTKRELSHTGLRENGFITYDENNQRKLKFKVLDIEATRDFIYSQFDTSDKAFLKMAEDFFNVISTEIKSKADEEIFGFTNIEDGYYVPMIRDRYSRMQGVTDQRQSIGSIITVYNKSFNQNTVQNAKALEGKNIMEIINDHADGLADYSELYLPLKAFDRVYNKGIVLNGETTSLREVLQNKVWNKTDVYLRDLFADIQGQNRKSDNVIDAAVGKLRSAWVNSVLGLNLKVVATQTTSYVAANQVIEAKYLMPALSKFLGNQSELGSRADEYSDIIEARSFEMGALRAQGNIDKVTEWSSKSGFMINLMDRRVCLAIFHAAELKAEAQGEGAVGTVENAKAAAKIADEAIYATQAMTSSAERSALQRSKSEIARTLSMFTSDTVKNLSHFAGNVMKYQAHRQRANSDLANAAEYQAELKKDAKAIRRSATTLVATGVMLGLITQAFKYLYAKEEEEPEDKAKDFAIDIASSTLNILPGVSDIIDKFVFNYDLSLNVFDIVNDVVEDTASVCNMAGRAMAGEYVSTQNVVKNIVNFTKTVGTVFGAPIAPVERTVTGLLRRFFPSAVYEYDSAFRSVSYTSDLKAAIESGDEALAEHILSTLYKNEATGVYSSDELEEVAELYQKGYTSVIPQKIGSEINGVTLDRKQRQQFESIYSQASAKVNELIRSEYYQILTDEQRAKAIKNLYALYYNRASAEVAGTDWSNAQAYSRLTDNYSALFAAQAYKSSLSAYKDVRGKEVSVKDQFIEYTQNLGLSETDYLVVIYANGYRDAATKTMMIAYINSLAVSDEEKAKIAQRLGFDFKDGKVTAREE